MMVQNNPLEKLEDAKLLVNIVSNGLYKGGYKIAKPASVSGNMRQGHEVFWGSSEIFCDAPTAALFPKNGKWVFEIWESVPGPGPGDFQETFETLSSAVDSVFDYYFGNDSRMNPPDFPGYFEG